MKLTNDLNPVTKITLRKCPTDDDLNEIMFERDLGRKDGARSRLQLFLTNDEMIQFEDTVSSYNRAFVEYM